MNIVKASTELGIWFVAVYMHSWGRGRSPEEAKKNARKAGGRGDEWYIKQLPKGAVDPYVDDFGGINWAWEDGEEPECYERGRLPVVGAGRGAVRNEKAAARRAEEASA